MTPNGLLAASGAALLAVIGAWWHGYETGQDQGRVGVQAQWIAERTRLVRAAEEARAERDATEQDWLERQQEVVNHAEKQVAEAMAARDAADAAAVRLRFRVEATAARCRQPASDPAPAAAGAPATDPGLLLADVLGRMEEAGRQLAQLADERGIAGQACQDAYGALNADHR